MREIRIFFVKKTTQQIDLQILENNRHFKDKSGLSFGKIPL